MSPSLLSPLRIATVALALSAGVALSAPGESSPKDPTPGVSPGGVHVVEAADIDASISARLDSESAQRDVIAGVLDAPEVERIARRSGVDIETARRNAATLSGAELEEISSRAAAVNARLVGGDTIVISATAVIIVLLILILLTD